MRFLPTAALAASLAVASPALAELDAPSGTYVLDPTHASLHFKVMHAGLSNYTARFTDMDVVVELDSANPENSTVSVTVDPTSIETDYPNPEVKDFDAELRDDPRFFNAGQFPQITFTSTKLTPTGDNTGTVEGDLTMLGVTRPVTMEVTLNGAPAKHPFMDAGALGISAVGTLRRSDFGMTHLIPAIGDEVEFIVEAELIEQK